MPKLKTRRSAAKRFSVTGTGKVRRADSKRGGAGKKSSSWPRDSLAGAVGSTARRERQLSVA